MVKQLEETKETSGCECLPVPVPYDIRSDSNLPVMGMSTWLGAGERPTSSEYATISYWRSIEDIHQFALSPIHRSAWEWWNKSVKEHSNLGIMHEVFEVPKRSGWEGIYINYHPTGLAATTKAVDEGEKSKVISSGSTLFWTRGRVRIGPVGDAWVGGVMKRGRAMRRLRLTRTRRFEEMWNREEIAGISSLEQKKPLVRAPTEYALGLEC